VFVQSSELGPPPHPPKASVAPKLGPNWGGATLACLGGWLFVVNFYVESIGHEYIINEYHGK
jgi:hypothetical protein